MKTIKISIAVIALGFALAGLTRPESSTEKFAADLLGSLGHPTIERFEELFPTLDEFHLVMERNRELFGSDFDAARQEFTDEYNHRIMPDILASYNAVKHEAAKRGISWNKVSLLRVSVDEDAVSQSREMTIYFSADGQVHRLVANAFKLNGEWKINIGIKLI
jgi:hypothetical protein